MSSAVNLIVVVADVVGWYDVICLLQGPIERLVVNVLIAYA